MKSFLILLCAIAIGSSASAQIPRLSKSELKENKEYRKDVQNTRDVKLKGETKKELKQYEQEGWKPAAGASPLALQLAKRDAMEEAFDQGLAFPGSAEVRGTSFNIMMKQALQNAKENVVENLGDYDIAEIIESSGANENEQLSYTKFLTASKSTIKRKLGMVQPVISMIKDNGDGTRTLRLRIYYNKSEIDKLLQDELRQSMEKQSNEVKERLNDIVDM